jgi:hypothetical protein
MRAKPSRVRDAPADAILGFPLLTKDGSGRRLWLRPGKRYLFGRTSAERMDTLSFSTIVLVLMIAQRDSSRLRATRRQCHASTAPSPSMRSNREMAYVSSCFTCSLGFATNLVSIQENVSARSLVTVEDLGSKGGTKVNGQRIKSDKYVLPQETNTLQMGSFPALFR